MVSSKIFEKNAHKILSRMTTGTEETKINAKKIRSIAETEFLD